MNVFFGSAYKKNWKEKCDWNALFEIFISEENCSMNSINNSRENPLGRLTRGQTEIVQYFC